MEVRKLTNPIGDNIRFLLFNSPGSSVLYRLFHNGTKYFEMVKDLAFRQISSETFAIKPSCCNSCNMQLSIVSCKAFLKKDTMDGSTCCSETCITFQN